MVGVGVCVCVCAAKTITCLLVLDEADSGEV